MIELTDQPLKQELTLSSVTSDGMKLSARIMLNTTLNNIANLIVGVANSMLTPTESIGTVTLMNSGTQTANNINFFAANHFYKLVIIIAVINFSKQIDLYFQCT